ncbi:hypothetical protein Bbelb_035620 [Branchiostoma belcheri]|nr:hypothetical protein Bbelb_035620 [Branchiostoma belcheri]
MPGRPQHRGPHPHHNPADLTWEYEQQVVYPQYEDDGRAVDDNQKFQCVDRLVDDWHRQLIRTALVLNRLQHYAEALRERTESESASEDSASVVENTESESASEDSASVVEDTESESASEDSASVVENTESESASEDSASVVENTESESASEDSASVVEDTESESASEDSASVVEFNSTRATTDSPPGLRVHTTLAIDITTTPLQHRYHIWITSRRPRSRNRDLDPPESTSSEDSVLELETEPTSEPELIDISQSPPTSPGPESPTYTPRSPSPLQYNSKYW